VSQLDFTTALARLLSDAELRAEFATHPAAVASRLADHRDDVAALLAIDPAELETQAVGLVRKRTGQVAALLPQTWNQLPDASTRFADFAAGQPWPEGHQRHLNDAVQFGAWLAANLDPALLRSEWNRCRFQLEGRRVALCLVSHPSIPLRQRGLRLMWRWRNRVVHWQLWLPLWDWSSRKKDA